MSVIKDKTIVSAMAVIGSLSGYYFAKYHKKDTAPYMMLGGFLGALMGDTLVEKRNQSNLNLIQQNNLPNGNNTNDNR